MEARRRSEEAASGRPARRRPRRLTLPARLLLAGAAHLFVLSVFAVAQPLLDLLSRNADSFARRGS